MKFLKKISFVYMADTPWAGVEADKLYLQSGQFTSTVKTSWITTSFDTQPLGITWNDADTFWAGYSTIKLYRHSGQFTSTLKDSESVSGIDTKLYGISCDDINTPWVGQDVQKLYLQSGQFTSTLKTSQAVSGVNSWIQDISHDGTNTPWAGTTPDKLYLQSGQFTSTIKDSENVESVNNWVTGISYDGTNTPWSGSQDTPTKNKLYLQSGQFTSTLKTSQDISSVDNNPQAICTNDYQGRIGGAQVYERSVSNTLSLGQSIQGYKIATRSLSSTIVLEQVVQKQLIVNRVLLSVLSLGQLAIGIKPIFYQFITDTLILEQEAIAQKICGYVGGGAMLVNIPRWIFASVTKYFAQVANINNLHFFVEGTNRETQNEQKYIELRVDGPQTTELSKGYYRFDVEINILWSFNQDNEDFHEPERIQGILIDAMTNICIYKFGDGLNDDDSLLGVLQLKQDNRNATRANNFGQIRPDVRLMQGTIEGTYSMELSTE